MKRAALSAIATLAIALSFAGCSAEVEVGMDRLSNTGASSGSGGTASGGTGGVTECMPASCGKSITWSCGDCDDDDGDGLIDAADPDCVGACDDTDRSRGRSADGRLDTAGRGGLIGSSMAR